MKKKIKRILIVVATAVILFAAVIAIKFDTMKKASRELLDNQINTEINMEQVADGTYTGSSDGGLVKVEVEVEVKDHKIVNINLLKHECGKGKPAESMLDDMVHNSSIIDEFHESIEKNEFKVYYQPKVNTETNDLCGAEALVRWIKDDRVIPPAEFIPVLENEGVVTEIDFYVFETVCRDIADWRQKGITPVTISSNFSKLHLANPDFADSILSIVKKYEIPHNLIEIELTESSGYSNYDALTHFVERMNIENINTSIDDFGTGYSSLSMLKDINVDVVKIDKSFLGKDDPIDTVREKMLGNVIRMIRDLDRTVICEGIETENQLNFLKKADCGVVQGYFFDKPLPHDEFELRLKHPHYDISL